LRRNGLLQLHVRCKRKYQFDFALSFIDSINVAFKSARGRPIETISVEPMPESSLFTDRSVSASNSWSGHDARRVRSEGARRSVRQYFSKSQMVPVFQAQISGQSLMPAAW